MRDDYQNAISNNFDVQNQQGVLIDAKPDERLASNYTCKDQEWNTGTHSGDIYISVPNDTHQLIENHHAHMNDPGYDGRYNLPESGYPGVSGFFTNEDTATHSFTDDGKFNSVQLGHDLQQSPYYDKKKAEAAEAIGQSYVPEYNSHLDCFRVNPDKMQENYGTSDFYAAMSRCIENTAWGDGGGFQGYNPYINEMINNGSLEYIPEKSRSCDSNRCVDYEPHKDQALSEAAAVNNYIESNNIQGKSGERLGYNELSQNTNITSNKNGGPGDDSFSNIASINGGGARAPNTPIESPDNRSNISGELPPQNQQPNVINEGQISGTLPSQSANPPALKEHENRVSGQLPQREQQPQIESGNRAVANLPERNQSASKNQQISGELPPQNRQPSVTNEGQVSGTLPPQNTNSPASQEHQNQISGTLPDQAQGIELPNNHTGNAVGKDLAETATKNNSTNFNPNNGIS